MANKKGGLGRGLDALIPDLPDLLKESSRGGDVIDVPIEDIKPNPLQPRLVFDEEAIDELAQSIVENGILSPLIVVARDNAYQLVSGERRLRAAERAGLKKVPVIVRELNNENIARLAIVENIQRENLNAYEEARGYDRLMNEFGHSATELAKFLGKSRPHIVNTVRLLQLPDSVCDFLISGELSAGHGRALLRLKDANVQLSLAKDCIATGCSVRGLETIVNDLLASFSEEDMSDKVLVRSHERQSNKRWQPMQQQLSEKLQTKVRISGDAKKGSLTIAFFGEEDLTRILDLLNIELV